MDQYSSKRRKSSAKHSQADDDDDMDVENSQNSEQQVVAGAKDARNLSGGEKSFSTVCLLLSLWEAMSCKIRGLDEFDVFMDPVNRRVAVGLLVETARNNKDTQHILISPQAIEKESYFGKDVRIKRLSPPRDNSGQTRIEDHF
jgi:structural maintenance of chromosomes protein 6